MHTMRRHKVPPMLTRPRLALWLLPALVALVYLPSLDFPFQFDDYKVIVDNPAVHSLEAWWGSMPGIRPLLKLSYALNWTLAPSPFAFRLVNVTLHAINALLVWRILSVLAQRLALPAALPWLTAALFAGHPIQTEAVTYVCGRSVSLMACFYLLSVLAWLQATGSDRPRQIWLSALAFLCALLTRETALILPFALWLAGSTGTPAPLPRPTQTSEKNPKATVLRADLHAYRWPLDMATIAALALACMLTLPAYQHFFSVAFAQRTPLDNLSLQVDAVYRLTSHLVRPALMNADPGLPTVVIRDAALAARAALLILLMALAALALRQRSFAGFCMLWFFLHLAPTNSFVPRIDVVNDRQLYLSAIGAFALLGLLACRAAQWLQSAVTAACGIARSATGRALHLLPNLLLTLTLIACPAWQAMTRNRVYRDEIAFWQDVTLKSPWNARAFNNLGYAYQLAGRHDAARAAYRHALALSASLTQAHWNLELLPPADADPIPKRLTAPASPDRPSSAH